MPKFRTLSGSCTPLLSVNSYPISILFILEEEIYEAAVTPCMHLSEEQSTHVQRVDCYSRAPSGSIEPL